MSKVSDAFKNGKAFIAFVTGGDPDLDTTKKLILEMEKNGADIIEVGPGDSGSRFKSFNSRMYHR